MIQFDPQYTKPYDYRGTPPDPAVYAATTAIPQINNA